MTNIAFVENRTSGVVKAIAFDWDKLSERLSECAVWEVRATAAGAAGAAGGSAAGDRRREAAGFLAGNG